MPAFRFPRKKYRASVALEELRDPRTHVSKRRNRAQLSKTSSSCSLRSFFPRSTTDARVNITTPALFAKYPAPADLARAEAADVEKIVKSSGFFRMKARNIIACARDLVERFGSVVPQEREQLESLAGVGRKTASVVMANAFAEARASGRHARLSRLSPPRPDARDDAASRGRRCHQTRAARKWGAPRIG